jgi:putative thioredoxin
MSEAVKNSTQASFEADVIEASHTQPVLVDFWAPWCAPCRVLGPVLEGLATKTTAWRLVKVNTENERGLAERFQIRSIPAVKLFADGAPIAEFVGALPASAIQLWLEQHLPTPAKKQLEAALRAKAKGDTAKAEALLVTLLEAEPDNAYARVELAALLLGRDPKRALELVGPLAGHLEVGEPAEDILRLAGLCVRQDEEFAPPAGPRFREGIRAMCAGSYEEAAKAWLEVVRRDRKLEQDGARLACIALFRWLGEAHAVTQTYRPQLALALY